MDSLPEETAPRYTNSPVDRWGKRVPRTDFPTASAPPLSRLLPVALDFTFLDEPISPELDGGQPRPMYLSTQRRWGNPKTLRGLN
jgi:hypothetical protein